MNIVVKVVQPPIEPRLIYTVDFDLNDAEEWGRYAAKHQCWRMPCVIGTPQPPTQPYSYDVEVAVAIASPDGRVAVWYGQATGAVRRDVSHYAAGLSVIGSRSVAAIWDDRRTRGGDRDVTPLATAACRVLHAHAFEYEPTPRDRLLAEFASLVGANRPPTAHIVKASDAALEAASVLLSIENYQAARALLAGKGVCGS